MTEGGECEAVEWMCMRRHSVGAEKRTLRSCGNGWLLSLLKKDRFEVLDGLHNLGSGEMQFVRTALKVVDVAPVLRFRLKPLLVKRVTFLFLPLLGGIALPIGSDETVVLIIQLCLSLLKALPLLNSGGNVRLNTTNLAVDLSLDTIKLGQHSRFVISLRLPFVFLNSSFLGLIGWNLAHGINLESHVGSSVISLANVLRELQHPLALTVVIASRISKATTKGIHLLFDGRDGSFVIFLVPLQAIPLLLQLLIGSRNRVPQSRGWR